MYSIEILNQQSFAFVNIIPTILIAVGLWRLLYVFFITQGKNKKWYICQIAGAEPLTQTGNPLLFEEKDEALEWMKDQVEKGVEAGYTATELDYIKAECIACFAMVNKDSGSCHSINVYETKNRSYE